MKPLRILSMIALTLLLSAASPTPQLKPSPRPTQQPSKTATFGDQQSHQNPTPIDNSYGSRTVDGTNGSASEQEDSHNTASIVIVISTVVTGIATALIAWFNCQLVGVTDEMKGITKIALNTNRPYLILDHAQITGVVNGDSQFDAAESGGEQREQGTLRQPPRFFPRIILEFHNYGNGPVIFKEGLIRIDALLELPKPRDFSACKPIHMNTNAVGPSTPWSPFAQFNYDVGWGELFPDIASGSKTVTVYGCIRYCGLTGHETYETGFLWVFLRPRQSFIHIPKDVAALLAPYRAPDAPDPREPLPMNEPADFIRGPTSHNYNT